MSERCPLRTTDQTQEVSEYFYFTNLYFSVMLQRALLAAFQCVHLPSFPFFLLCFCPSFPYSPHVLHFILVLLVSSFPFSLSLSDLFCCCISFIPTFFFHFGSSSVFPSLLISFHVSSSFLCLFLLSFVLLYFNLTSSFFLVFYIYSHRASDVKSDLSVWFFEDIYILLKYDCGSHICLSLICPTRRQGGVTEPHFLWNDPNYAARKSKIISSRYLRFGP